MWAPSGDQTNPADSLLAGTQTLLVTDATAAFDLQAATGYRTSALTGTITNAQLAGSIAGSKLVTGSVTATHLGVETVTASELADDAVDTAAVANGAITTAKIADGAVTTAKLS